MQEGSFEWYKSIFNSLLKDDMRLYQNQYDSLQLLLNLKKDFNIDEDKTIRDYAMKISKYTHKMADYMAQQTSSVQYNDLYWQTLLFESPYHFESYMLYTEKDREPKEKFYVPRKRCFDKIGIVDAMQKLEDDIYYILCLSLVPGSGKTTLGEFFMSWVMGKHPENYNLMSSHSGHVTDMFHTAVKNIITSKEYKWMEIFPNVRVDRINEKASTINLDSYKPFASLTCRAIGASQTGVTRCNGYLYCDDLVSGLEEAVNKQRLDKKNQQYATDLKTRKKEGCKEIHIANRTSVYDVIGNIERQFSDDPRVKIIAIPDIDPETGESNFDFDYGVGFSTKYFEEIEKTLDEVTYKCMFKNQPIEREGLLYHDEDFRRYYELPEREPDAILGVCDTKDTGTDYCFLPLFYQYGDDFYFDTCVYDNGAIEVIDEEIASLLISKNPHTVQFESNSAGGRMADNIREKIKGKSRTRITKKYTTQNKETKIIVNSGWIKQHVLLKDKSTYSPKSPYGKALAALFSYSVAGKNPTDDVPDGMGMFAEFVAKGEEKPTVIFTSPY